MFTRSNVYELGGDWADPILWYARGVAAMKARPLADATSWRFYGAMHGIDPPLWQALGYLSASDTMPGNDARKRFWQQCQHGTWYFLPWHRGYLIAFEANVRAAVVKLGGPSDWALPYWNYFKDGQSQLPPAFASPDWPDGQGNNPLFVPQRYGPDSDGNVFVPLDQVNLNALTESEYTGVSSGGSPGFGGVDTGFMHSGRVHGGVETQPHDWVHGLVGGGDPQNPQMPGLMSDPDTAGLDPIFWLHHSNIDRLWEVWRENPTSNVDPDDANWIKGPANVGERKFSMPMPDGTSWDYTPGDMSNLSQLGYTYDDLSAGVPAPQPAARLMRLGLSPAAALSIGGAADMGGAKEVEMVGANQGALRISGGGEHRTSVQLDAGVRSKVAASLDVSSDSAAPDRVFLNLENVRGLADATAFHVYVGVPEGANPTDYPDRKAGSIALFGVRKASRTDAEHGGEGLNYVLEITNIVDALHLNNAFDVNSLDVRIVPVKPVHEDSQISIGRISIYRQG